MEKYTIPFHMLQHNDYMQKRIKLLEVFVCVFFFFFASSNLLIVLC